MVPQIDSSQITPDEQSEALFDEANPRALINLVPPKLKLLIKSALQSHPFLFNISEAELLRDLKGSDKYPDAGDRRLRLKFWAEYEYTQGHMQKQMSSARVFAGICHEALFYKIVHDPYKLAFLVNPPHSYMVKVEEGLSYVVDELRQVIEQPLIDPLTGKFDHKLAELKLKIAVMFDVRLKGAITQKVEHTMKSINMNVNLKDAAIASETAALDSSVEDLEKRIKELEHHEVKPFNTLVAESKVVSEESIGVTVGKKSS